ncbi:hypothetical protein M409DRAFT_61369 [Zasmidium cellare ATCC 36951]|uniref:F-box domain-containing protein n=1 Tax=Zasmidium cellare ATCC 36951 TaxID=1080233 RepID=A0A6A6BYW7_ZASCE|nr:uncharacterized protein M409DRAFT_61369 [Zasmidium cellare ATCC 36951]KAF2158782.1 hypothetical protein M409DRAFT_61369 [Zasmidium cellare ATCC 36951]
MSADLKTLLSLPAEICELTANCLEASDLLTFRSLCKEIEAKTYRVFSSTCFGRRTLRLSSGQSLRHNLMVLGLPTLGPMIRTVIISEDKHQPGAISRAALSAAVLQKSRVDFRLLRRYFRQLRHLGLQVKVVVPARRGSGAMRHFSIDGDVPSDHAWHLPVHKLIETNGLGLLHKVFTSVESLTLDVWVEDEGLLTSTTPFFACIASLPSLRSLTIYGQHRHYESLKGFDVDAYAIAEVLLQQDFPRLRVLKLWGCVVFVDLLVDFLRRHRQDHRSEEFQMGRLDWEWDDFDEEFDRGNEAEMSNETLQTLTGVRVEYFKEG